MLKKEECTHSIFLPCIGGGDEEGGLVDLAGGNGLSGRGVREVGTILRDCDVMKGERQVKPCMKDNEHRE